VAGTPAAYRPVPEGAGTRRTEAGSTRAAAADRVAAPRPAEALRAVLLAFLRAGQRQVAEVRGAAAAQEEALPACPPWAVLRSSPRRSSLKMVRAIFAL